MDTPVTITAIDAMPKDPNERRIRVGRRTVGVLSAQRVDALRLRVGQKWTPRLAARVEHAVAVDAARREALRLLGRSAMSSGSLRTRVLRLELDEPAVDQAIGELLDDGWLDDRAFAVGVADAALRRGPLGAKALVARLRRRGVDAELAESVAAAATTPPLDGQSGATDDDATLELAVAWATSSLRRAGKLPPLRAARRVAAGLSRRGIDEDTIHQVLERLGLDLDS